MKSKKGIIALLLVAIIGVVGLTIAYFTNTANIENEFRTNSYGTTVVEEFVSPDNWTPGTTTEKTLVVTNSGNVDEAMRVEVTESWTSKNGDPLPLKQNGNDVAIINWANTDDWTPVTENNKNYYYYNYKLAPTEVTSTLLESVTFNPLITNDSNCQTTEANGTTTITCNPTENGYDGATYRLTFKVETVQYDKYKEAWGTSFDIAAEKPHPGTQYLAENATKPVNTEYNSETKGNLFAFTHGEGANQVTESRYIGDAPNNYVKFNCDNGGTNCEIWRILGVFDVQRPDPENVEHIITEQRMKLVRGSEFSTTMAFNSVENNDWTVSPLNTFLNGDYYNRTGEASTYGLKELAKNMIDDAVYYLGAISFNSGYGNVEKIYGEESGTTVCGACNDDNTRLTWTGIVGLMYPSDEYMVYGNGVNAKCYDNTSGCRGSNATTGWVFNSNIREGQTSKENTWLLSSYAGYLNFVLLTGSGGVLSYGNSDRSIGVRPVVYLKSSIQIIDGDGTSGNPYVLK